MHYTLLHCNGLSVNHVGSPQLHPSLVNIYRSPVVKNAVNIKNTSISENKMKKEKRLFQRMCFQKMPTLTWSWSFGSASEMRVYRCVICWAVIQIHQRATDSCLRSQTSLQIHKRCHTQLVPDVVNIKHDWKCVLTSVCLFNFLKVNPNYDSTFVFENDFPALQPDAPDPGEF